MSLVKKLNNEIHDWNFDSYNIWVYNSVLFHWYKILDDETNKSKYFYYNSNLSYKENINNLKLKVIELYGELDYVKINSCYYNKKYITINNYIKCKQNCFYKAFCERNKE